MVWFYHYRLFDLGNAWYIWIFCYLLYDLLFYIIHYLGHRVRFFWCIHGVHHTAEEMKLTVAVRGSFFGFLLTPHNTLWLPLLGFDPFMVLIVDGIAKIYGLFEHVNEHFISAKGGWIEKLFITPSAHRVHHSKTTCIWTAITEKPFPFGIICLVLSRKSWNKKPQPMV